MTIVEQLKYYADAMAPSGLGGPGQGLASSRRAMLSDAATEIERLRAALIGISMHELRDHEDYTAIQEMAEAALRTPQNGEG